MMPLQIYAVGSHAHIVDSPLPDLKQLTQQATGKSFRRIGRFIQLALIGAARCRGTATLPSDTAVYFASSRGDLELTVEIMDQLFRAAQTPKPLSFVNTVSNAACFYVAQLLGLQSRSNFVCNRQFALESVLQLAALDLRQGTTTSALVGSVDIATEPLDDHRQRLSIAAEVPVSEGSHWLWLGPVDYTRPRIGELLSILHFPDRDALLSWLSEESLHTSHCKIAQGQTLQAQDYNALIKATHLSAYFSTIEMGTHGSQCGNQLCDFLSNANLDEQLLLINADDYGRYHTILISR